MSYFLSNYDGPKVFTIQYLFCMVARWHLARAISSIMEGGASEVVVVIVSDSNTMTNNVMRL